jgi:hypothetical protein
MYLIVILIEECTLKMINSIIFWDRELSLSYLQNGVGQIRPKTIQLRDNKA